MLGQMHVCLVVLLAGPALAQHETPVSVVDSPTAAGKAGDLATPANQSAGTGAGASEGVPLLPSSAVVPVEKSKALVPPSIAIASIVLGLLLMALAITQARRRTRTGATKEASAADERSAARVGTSFAANVTQQAVAELATQVRKLSSQLRSANDRIEELEKQRQATVPNARSAQAAQHVQSQGQTTQSARSAIDAKPSPMHVVPNANPLHQQVYALADSGLTSVQIAQAVSLPTGQVELILNLRRALGLSQGA